MDTVVPPERDPAVVRAIQVLQESLTREKTMRAEAEKKLRVEQEQQALRMRMSPEDRAREVERLVESNGIGFHRDAIPDRLIPWVTPHDQNVSISDADMWLLAKFRPWHPVIRNRMPPSSHYLLRNVPPGINPSLIEQFLGGLYNRDAGDTYRFPSDSSWDPRHGIIIEPLEPKFSSDGLNVTYEYTAWYQHCLNNQSQIYHNVAISTKWLSPNHKYSHLPVSSFRDGNSRLEAPDVDSTRIIPFKGIGGSQRVLPLAAGALSEVGTVTPNQDELSRTERLTPVTPGEVEHPEVVDRFSIDDEGFRSRNDESTAKFDEEKASTRYLARMEHENVYRKPAAFAQGHNNADSSVIHKDDLLKARKERAARVIAKAKQKRLDAEHQSKLIADLSPSIEDHIDLSSSSSEDERRANVLHDTPILSSGVTQKIKKKSKKDSKKNCPFLKNDERSEVVSFLHDFSHWAVHKRKQQEHKSFDTWLGYPRNKFDFARTALCEVDPEGVSEFIDQTTLSTWRMMDTITDSNSTAVLEQSIWRLLVDKSQYSSTTAASNAIRAVRLGRAKDPLECIEKYLCNIIVVLKCSMAIPSLSSDSAQREHLHASTVADVVLSTLNPNQDIVPLNELHVRWDQQLKTDDSLLPQFFNEVKGI
ncbi:hypothetical protein GEMRC1_007797 [Eukaryota sp. GEM-RC1]